jgi:hypothetical protein
VTRFNYLSSRFERAFGVPVPAHAGLSRSSQIALAAAALLVAVLAGMQIGRFHAVASESAALAERRAAIAPALDDLRRVEAEVRRLGAMAAADRTVRRSGTLRANEVAAIGNALPADAWLTGLRVDAATVAVDGRGARLHAVAETLDALAALRSVSSARLVSVRHDPLRADVVYSIAMERRR